MAFWLNHASSKSHREFPSGIPPLSTRKGRNMAPRYTQPSVEPISENEGESMLEPKSKEAESEVVVNTRRHERRYDSIVTPARTSTDRHRDKPRRGHKATSSVSSRGSMVVNPRLSNKRAPPTLVRDDSAVDRRRRHHRTQSQPNDLSSSSSSEEEEGSEDHNTVLAASRERLTSPSLISTLTSLTTATNNSGGSSGSNSTVTQASLSRELASKRLESTSEAPLSPAVPDPPDVFSFLDAEGEEEEEEEEEEDEEQEEQRDEDGNLTEGANVEQQWLSEGIYDGSSPPAQSSPVVPESLSSSGSSSFHSDYTGSEPAADNDTDRSTSPERSVKGEEDTARPAVAPPATPASDPAASKLASQMLAAQHRQNLHSAFQTFGPPQMPRVNHSHPHAPSTALSPRVPQQLQPRIHPRTDKPPSTGYDALASKISTNGSKSSIKPIYRKFECLNHRLLLHLQDEISELEEQLHRLDAADTQSRSVFGPTPGDVRIVPASRRAAAHAGGELEWHKMDIMNRITYKLAQYNQALASFSKVVQDLETPDSSAIKHYRSYLQSEQPVMENETRFLEAAGDLVTLSRKESLPALDQPKAQLAKSELHKRVRPDTLPPFHIIAAAVAVAVLIPILTFAVIPGFLGRMTVVLLVAGSLVGALFQAGVMGVDGGRKMGKDWASCAVIYGGVMVILAGILL